MGRSGAHTVIVIIAYNELFQLAVLAQLAPDVLVKSVEVVLQLAGVHPVLGVVRRVLVQVRHEDRLAVRGLDVLPRAAVAVAARADFLRSKMLAIWVGLSRRGFARRAGRAEDAVGG